MSGSPQRLRSAIERYSPYPLAVQGAATLALLAAPLSALGVATAPWRLWSTVGIMAVLLVALTTVPARRLPLWAQILYLIAQAALATTARAFTSAPLLDYVYLTIVLQAITLFRPWLWIPFAVAIWATWSGVVLIAGSGLWAWLQSNLALAFPATCAIIAAIVYMRQLRRGEQAQQMLQQMQQRYDSLALALRDLQQHVAQEERERLARAVAAEVETALARTEQSVASAMAQAQTNLARLQAAVAQTRHSAAAAVDRLRQAIVSLRGEAPPPSPGGVPAAPLTLGDEHVIGPRANVVFTWVLPSVFLSLAVALTALQPQLSAGIVVPVVVMGALLILVYVCTQQVRHPALVQAGLAGQTFAVITMTAITNSLPLLLGLLLVLWQIATRLNAGQVALFLASAPATLGLFILRLRPAVPDTTALLACVVAAAAVGGPLYLARRQHARRRQAELRLALLNAEIEQQTSEIRALALSGERARLAREFHDDLGSRLVLINLQLQLAEELAGEDPEAALEQLRISRESLHAAWHSALAVADAELSVGGEALPAALADLVARCRASTSAAVALRVEGPLDDLPAPVAHSVFRAVQEGLTNACKHARPEQIDVHVVSESRYVTVTVLNDNCPGGQAPRAGGDEGGSFGLVGLRERAEALGGGVEAGPAPGGGWRLRLVLPAEGG